MLSEKLIDMAKSFKALATDDRHDIVITHAQAENFASAFLDYGQQAAALENKPIPSAEILQFPLGRNKPENTGTETPPSDGAA